MFSKNNMKQGITKLEQQHKSDERIKKLLEYLSLQQDILLAFIFGSFASRDVTAMSDLDIALNEPNKSYKPEKRRQRNKIY